MKFVFRRGAEMKDLNSARAGAENRPARRVYFTELTKGVRP